MASLAVLAALSACSGGQQISATQEASRYEQHAHRSYAPPGPPSDPWGPYIKEASNKYDVPVRWIREVMRVESGGHTELNGVPITSPAGAMGLMQVIPATYDELRGRYPQLGDDPYDPYNSILAGAAYIRELYDLYGSPGFLAAYNSGPGRLDDYLTRNRPLPDETRRYVAMIGPNIADSFPSRRSTAEEYALNAVPANIPAGPRYASATPSSTQQPSPPVEVAYAPPSDALSSGSDAAFDPPPGWTPRGMSKAEIAAYVPPPGNPPPAEKPPAYRPPAAQPPRTAVAQNDLPPAIAYSPAPMPGRPETVPPARRYEPPAPAPRSEPAHYAALPEPPPYVPSAPAMQTASATGYGSGLDAAPHREQGFRLVPPALAAAAPYYRGTTPSQWAIQVGAFGNEGLAHIAVGTAREQAGSVVAGAHLAVASVREPHGMLYRARLTGLSREAATVACERLRGHGSCVVLSPNTQD